MQAGRAPVFGGFADGGHPQGSIGLRIAQNRGPSVDSRDAGTLARLLSGERKREHQRGAVLVLVALGSVALLGAVGLALDGSLMLEERRHAQAVADQAALAAAHHRCTVDGSTATT